MVGLEINWRERTGDITYEKEEWRKNPADRFRFFAMHTVQESNLLSERQKDWLDSHMMDIPGWEHLNPTATVLGMACLHQRQFSKEKFEQVAKVTSRFPKNRGVRPIDIIRYAKAWERWYKEKLI